MNNDIPVKLSLCMIVKNEEKNIAKTLDCVRHIIYEKIVVDTGSTDKTVEIAEEMGAKVYHFSWINDFSAARNYSLEQATGDWITYIDADEYYSYEDAEKLINLLNQIQAEPEKWGNCQAVSSAWVNIDDDGRQMTKASKVNIFRNSPEIRFIGKIHEQVTVDINNIIHADDITLMHTGYSASAHQETGKAKRNIALLRNELAEDSKNLNLKAYLANALSMSTDERDQSEAELLFSEILNSKENERLNNVHRIKMYMFFINKYMNDPGKLSESETMCRRALTAFPNSVDFGYFLAMVLSKKGEYDKAWETLMVCEENLISGANHDDSLMIPADPTILFGQMILTAKNRGDIENVILYSTHVLTMDKTRLSILGPCIATLLYYGVTDAEVIDLLSNIYDFNDADDNKIVVQAANNCGAVDFANKISRLV